MIIQVDYPIYSPPPQTVPLSVSVSVSISQTSDNFLKSTMVFSDQQWLSLLVIAKLIFFPPQNQWRVRGRITGECQAAQKKKKKPIVFFVHAFFSLKSNYVLKRGLRNKHKFDPFFKILGMRLLLELPWFFFSHSIITRDWLSVLKSHNIYEILGSKFIKVRILLKYSSCNNEECKVATYKQRRRRTNKNNKYLPISYC